MPTTTSKISVIAKQLRDAAEILAKIADSCDTLIVATESNGTSVKSRIVSPRGKRGTKGLSRTSTKGLTGKRLFPKITERPKTMGRRSKVADKSLATVLKQPGKEWNYYLSHGAKDTHLRAFVRRGWLEARPRMAMP